MDQHGVEMMILSLNAPAVQAIHDVKRAADTAKKANDFLAEQVAKNPRRFQAFAALPLQDPDLATRELERCVKELGFRGALVNGFSQAGTPDNCLYYDLPQYWPLWSLVESLDLPFYLHPRNPLKAWAQIYDGHPWLLGPTWAFGQETAVHAVSMTKGTDDEFKAIVAYLTMHFGVPVKINKVTAKQLDDVMILEAGQADAIIKYRDEHGPFADLEALLKVPGLNLKLIDEQKANLVFAVTN